MRREENEQKKRLESKIYYLEDMLLRSRKYYEQEEINKNLRKLRMELSKMRA